MRSSSRIFLHFSRFLRAKKTKHVGRSLVFIFLALTAATAVTLQLPLGQQPSPSLGIPDASGHRPGEEEHDPRLREINEKLASKRNAARQEQLVKDTNKLLALATDLKGQVDQTNKNVLSIDVIKKAEEIEKLAKNVKDRMKD